MIQTYTFDVKCFVTVDIEAESEAAARAKIDDEVMLHQNFESVSIDGEADLTEIDGEPVEDV